MSKLKRLTNDLLEELVEAQREQYHSDLQPFEAYKAQIMANLSLIAENYQNSVKTGYHTLLDELKKERELSSNPATLRPYEEFLILRKNITKKKNKSVQQKVGISNDALRDMYATVSKLLAEKRYDDARNMLSFLVFLNPNVLTFWIAMGRVYELEENKEAALEGYKMAIFIDPDSLKGYRNAIRCCIDLKKWDEANLILDTGIKALEEASDSEKTKDVQVFLKKLKQLVIQKQGVS